jgi:hypothetical protein
LYDFYEDYLPLAAIGEARHGNEENHYYIEEINLEKVNHDEADSRVGVQKAFMAYDPEQFMPFVKQLFESPGWSGGFGGSSWANIVNIWLRREELTPELWVHQVSDLAHNNGYCFDKAPFIAKFNPNSYALVMAMRSEVGLLEGIKYRLIFPIELLKVPYLIGAKKFLGEEWDCIEFIPNNKYERIKWGTKTVSGVSCNTEQPYEEEYEQEESEELEPTITFPSSTRPNKVD